MKHDFIPILKDDAHVAPCAGAWIETCYALQCSHFPLVAPCAGAWIETWKRKDCSKLAKVAPCAGAWIETFDTYFDAWEPVGRPLRGGVD